MKLDRFAVIVLASAVAAMFGCGCSATASTAGTARTTCVAQNAALTNAVGTTNLMSAELPGPAPRVGKAHLAVDENESLDTTANEKEPRRDDGSHRGGGFGTSSK